MDEESYEEILAEFDKLSGMDSVKEQIVNQVNYFVMHKKKKKRKEIYMNMRFTGAPGTGKTTVAELLARLMKCKGLLSTGEYHEINAADLKSKYHNETEEKLLEELNKANGGLLVIDEFYAFNSKYGDGSANTAKGVLDAMCGTLEKLKDSLCVVIIGYEEDIKDTLAQNRGAEGRFPYQVEFEDYSTETLMEIFDQCLLNDEYSIVPDARVQVISVIEARKKSDMRKFQNARFIVEDLYPKLESAMFNRDNEATEILLQDVKTAFPKSLISTKERCSDQNKKYELLPKDMHDLPEPYKYINAGCTNTEEILFKLTEPSVLYLVVEFEGNEGYGTGFLIHPDGYALTCNHVIKSKEGKIADKITARLRIPGRMGCEDTYHNCVVVKTFEQIDMSLIKLTDGSNFPYLKLAQDGYVAKELDKFLLLGYPFGEKNKKGISVNTCKITSVQNNPDGNGIDRYNIQGEAKKGNSGSPAISLETGEVIGLLPGAIQAYEGDYEEINYLRPIKYFWERFFN